MNRRSAQQSTDALPVQVLLRQKFHPFPHPQMVHIDAIYQPRHVFDEEIAKLREEDYRVFSLQEGRTDRRYTLALAKTWDWENACAPANTAARLLDA